MDIFAGLNPQLMRDFVIPPPSFVEMEGELVDYVPGKSLRARFPVKPKYQNPAKVMQGGFTAAAVDNTFGPFSFLEAKKPTTTLEFNLSYVRPITPDCAFIEVFAELMECSKNYVVMKAAVRTPAGKVAVYAQMRMQILG